VPLVKLPSAVFYVFYIFFTMGACVLGKINIDVMCLGATYSFVREGTALVFRGKVVKNWTALKGGRGLTKIGQLLTGDHVFL
jgi:hypothetical protein